jgi:DNA-binding transcriptional LysR family regulator
VISTLRALAVILREGSLNRAATRLGISQSALSRQVQALEAEIGGKLLERTSTGVRPTNAGHALNSSMTAVLRHYDDAMAEARRLVRGQHAQMRIGYLGSAARAFLNPALTVFRRRHPEIRIRLRDLSPGEQIAALRAGEIDVALIGQEGALADSEFYTRKLATLPMMAFLPAEHRLAGREQIRLRELRGEIFTTSPDDDLPGRDRWLARLCRRAGFRHRGGPLAATLSEAFTLVSGEGHVFVAPAYLRNFPAAGIVGVTLADDWIAWDFLVAWQRGRTGQPVRVLLDALSAAVIESSPTFVARKSRQPPPANRKKKRAP